MFPSGDLMQIKWEGPVMPGCDSMGGADSEFVVIGSLLSPSCVPRRAVCALQ